MKPREYCCCAIPLLNAGIYATLTEQFVLGVVAGALAVGTSKIVGAATPSFAPWIFAIVCWVGAALQVLGLLGVINEKALLFRRYIQLHFLATCAAFAVAAVWVIISATKHSTAQTNCQNKYFPEDTTSEGETMCKIFPWVDVGIMGGLWILLAISQLYFYIVVLSYSKSQRTDHKKIDGEYDPVNPLTGTGDIPMQSRGDPWDSRPSTETVKDDRGSRYNHVRQDSDASVSTTLGEKVQRPVSGYGGYPAYESGEPARPTHAYTEDPEPTPYYNNAYYSSDVGDTNRPERIQPHPAEGSFGRKAPRHHPEY